MSVEALDLGYTEDNSAGEVYADFLRDDVADTAEEAERLIAAADEARGKLVRAVVGNPKIEGVELDEKLEREFPDLADSIKRLIEYERQPTDTDPKPPELDELLRDDPRIRALLESTLDERGKPRGGTITPIISRQLRLLNFQATLEWYLDTYFPSRRGGAA